MANTDDLLDNVASLELSNRLRAIAASAAVLLSAMSCAGRPAAPGPATGASPGATATPAAQAARDPFAAFETRARASVTEATEDARAYPAVLLTHATVLTATGKRLEPGFVLMEHGSVAAVGEGDGANLTAGTGAMVVDARGKFVTPGIIDPHSHMGVYPVPETAAHDDGNELTDPITAGLRAEHSFWPQDPAIERAVEGGVTTIAVLPGSGNLIGGRGIVMHLLPTLGARAMRFPGAPEILKMACGENPKRVYGDQKRAPSTRMGSLRAVRDAFIKAQKYAREWAEWTKKAAEAEREPHAADHEKKKDGKDAEGKPPDRDLALETLALVMRGDILVEWHCYQADDMLAALQVADEFGFKVRAFHHALEAYKIRDVLAREGVGIATWDDWWGFKMEAYDGIPENLALFTEAGGRAALHSDSPVAIQMLNQAAGKALAAGRAAGVKLDENDAIRWLTANPAWVLGIDDQVGTLEPGKRADVVVWNEDPLSTYARADLVYIDGRLVFDRAHPGAPWSDFELGVRPSIGVRPSKGAAP
jgi:imidazolonepropionase-like amidohydrolase